MDALTLSTIAFVVGMVIGAIVPIRYLTGKFTTKDEWELSAEAQRQLDRHFCGRR